MCGLVTFPVTNGHAYPKRKILKYDRAKLKDPARCKQFREIMNSMPAIPMHVDNASHCYILDTNVYNALCTCFPEDAIKKRQEYISESTFRAIVQVGRERRMLFKLRSRFCRASVRAAFGIWSNKPWFCKWTLVFGFSSFSNLRLWSQQRRRFKEESYFCKALLKDESAKYFSNLCTEVVDAFESDNMKSMCGCVGRVIKASKSRSNGQQFARVNDSQGHPAQSLSEEKYIFREHFGDLMGGTTCTFESLLVADRKVASDRYDKVVPSSIALCIPSVDELALLYRTFREGKGYGESRICTDVFKQFPDIMSRLQYPLVVKTFVRIQPPLQWKGGMLCELFKNKGSTSMCGNYRDILLADDSGKGVMKLIRKRLLPLAASLTKQTQFGGGLNGGETAFAHLYVRLIIDWAINSQTSCSILFLDAVAAFASMLRRIVFNYEHGDEAWLASLYRAGFSESSVKHIYDSICSYDWVDNLTNNHTVPDGPCSAGLDFRVAEQLFTNSWVTQEHIPNVVNITKGSSAGTPLADLVYSMALSRVLDVFRNTLEREGLTSSYCLPGTKHDIVDVSFVDDVGIPCIGTASEIVAKIGRVASCAFNVFQTFGMKLNFKPGKSEAIIGFFGTGARLAKRQLTLDEDRIPIEAGDDTHLRVVKSYQHLGTCTAVSVSMCEEVTKRNGMMRAETSRLCKAILQVPQIPVPKKIKVVQVYVLTKGTFQCSAWPDLPDPQYKRFHSCILGIYRRTCGNYFKSSSTMSVDVAAMFNDDDIIYKYGFMCPRTILRMSRLMLLVRIVAKSPPFLLDLSLSQGKFKRGWVSSIVSDLRWLCGSTKFADCLEWDFSRWVEYIKGSPHAAAKQIKDYCKSPFANICVQWAKSQVLRTFADPIDCIMCGKISKSKQAHAVHLSACHGIKCAFRLYIPCTHCLICLREFWTRERCLNHVKKSKVCKFNLILRGPSLSHDEADSLDQMCRLSNRQLYAAGRRRHAADKSSIRLAGPLEPIILMESQVSAHHPLGIGQRHH